METGETMTITVTRTGDSNGMASVSYTTESTDNTATPVEDYTPTSGNLNWDNGDSSPKTFTITILDDTTEEDNEIIYLNLKNATNAELGIPTTVPLTIVDEDTVPDLFKVGHWGSDTYQDVVVVGNYAYVAAETTGLEIFDISDPANPVMVGHYDTKGEAYGVALSGNYAYVAAFSGGLQIIDISNPANPVAVGRYYTSGYAFGVALSGNYAYMADYHKGLQIIDISNPANPVAVGRYNTGGHALSVALDGNYIYVADGGNQLEILRFNPPQPGTLQFSAASFTVMENDTSLEISVTRTAGSKGTVSVQYRITGGTATVGTDYTMTPYTLNWADGDTEAKNFTVNPINDSDPEGDETFTIELYNPENATIGSPNSATVTIEDDDITSNHGTLQLSTATKTVAENAGTVTITVTRTEGSDGNITIDYATSDDSATAGSDYTETSDTLNWTDGESADKTFDVGITDDSSEEDDETFIVSLGNPTGGAQLGSPDTATVTIRDDDKTFNCKGVSEIPKKECLALVALYDSTDGQNWEDNTGWKATNSPCSWDGVTCQKKHVTGLALGNNNLKGSISEKFLKLKKLETLILSDNDLNGTSLNNFNKLKNLETLLIDNCRLKGKIPNSLMKLKKLTIFNLKDNCLKTEVSKKLKKWLDEINPGWDETQTNCLY
jgi:hypothetical protein